MTYYTYSTVPVLDPATSLLQQNATDGKFVTVPDGAALPIYDWNLVPVSSVTSNALGQSSQFKVEDQRRGYVQFGDVSVRVWADEVADELDALETYMDEINAAVAAAEAAAALAAQGGGGLPAGTTLEQIPNGATRLAFLQAERDKLQLIADGATAVQLGNTQFTEAKRGNWMPTTVEIGAVRNVAGFGRVWGRTAAQGKPTVPEGLQVGDYAFIDVS